MKKLFAFFLLTLCLTAGSQTIYASGTNGLLYDTYAAGGATPGYTQAADGTINNRTKLSSGTVSTVNYQWGGGGVLNSGRAEGVIVRFHGYINIPTAGTYYFGGQADDGIRIRVNNTQVVDSWIESGGAFREGSVSLPAGVVAIELIYYENGGGAMVNLQWYQNNTWQIIPSTSLATNADFWAPPPPPPPPTPVYGNSAITTIQSNKRTSGLAANPNGHNSIVEVAGDDNLVSIQQIGMGGHYVNVNVQGSVNNVDVLQTSNTTARHYMEATVAGGNNNLILQQRETAKTQIVDVNGNNNTVTTNQKGTGNHFLQLTVTGNNHTAGVIQDGAGNHNARVILDGSQPWNFQLNQAGSTGKNYNLPHSMSDGSSVSGTCSAVGGCSLIVNQQ
jgi:hypothetical protein